MNIVMVIGARPNVMKAAPLVQAIARHRPHWNVTLIHTGQHSSPEMASALFGDLGIRPPDIVLELGGRRNRGRATGISVPTRPCTAPTPQQARGGTTPAERQALAQPLARQLVPVLTALRPDAVVVFGDVDSTVAGTLAARDAGIVIVHVEAGLRAHDPDLPEEGNRILVDSLSDYHVVTEAGAVSNLVSEGVARGAVVDLVGIHSEDDLHGSSNGGFRPGGWHLGASHEQIHHGADQQRKRPTVFFTGNPMIDSLHTRRVDASTSQAILQAHGLLPHDYVLASFHRQGNVDDPAKLATIFRSLTDMSASHVVIFPVHPRTRDRLEACGLWDGLTSLRPRLGQPSGLVLTGPANYTSFQALLASARIVVTDSGGVQEEATVLNVPCLTVRDSTERPATVELGTNVLTALDASVIVDHVQTAFGGRWKLRRRIPDGWDGRSAERMVVALDAVFLERSGR